MFRDTLLLLKWPFVTTLNIFLVLWMYFLTKGYVPDFLVLSGIQLLSFERDAFAFYISSWWLLTFGFLHLIFVLIYNDFQKKKRLKMSQADIEMKETLEIFGIKIQNGICSGIAVGLALGLITGYDAVFDIATVNEFSMYFGIDYELPVAFCFAFCSIIGSLLRQNVFIGASIGFVIGLLCIGEASISIINIFIGSIVILSVVLNIFLMMSLCERFFASCVQEA